MFSFRNCVGIIRPCVRLSSQVFCSFNRSSRVNRYRITDGQTFDGRLSRKRVKHHKGGDGGGEDNSAKSADEGERRRRKERAFFSPSFRSVVFLLRAHAVLPTVFPLTTAAVCARPRIMLHAVLCLSLAAAAVTTAHPSTSEGNVNMSVINFRANQRRHSEVQKCTPTRRTVYVRTMVFSRFLFGFFKRRSLKHFGPLRVTLIADFPKQSRVYHFIRNVNVSFTILRRRYSFDRPRFEIESRLIKLNAWRPPTSETLGKSTNSDEINAARDNRLFAPFDFVTRKLARKTENSVDSARDFTLQFYSTPLIIRIIFLSMYYVNIREGGEFKFLFSTR